MIFLIENFSTDNVDVDVSEDVSITSAFFHLLSVTIIFLVSNQKWASLLEKINDFSKYKKSSNFNQLNKKLNMYSLIYVIYCLGGVVVFALIAKYNKIKCLKINVERNLHEQCGFFVPVWFPIVIPYPWNEVYFGLQAIGAAVIAPTAAIIFTIPFQVAMNIVLKIDDLKNDIIDVFEESDAAKQREKFVYCVQYHQFILRFSFCLK